MRISDWSSDVCSSDLQAHSCVDHEPEGAFGADEQLPQIVASGVLDQVLVQFQQVTFTGDDFHAGYPVAGHAITNDLDSPGIGADVAANLAGTGRGEIHRVVQAMFFRSEEHTYELQSLMRISYAVFCLKKKTTQITITKH